MSATAIRETQGSYALFTTPIGRCGIVWNDLGILRIQLPEATPEETLARLTGDRELRQAKPPAAIAAAIARITRHLKGEAQDLSDLPLDVRALPSFQRRVYASARKIPAGRTATYGELAHALAMPKAARAVGRALGVNPFPIVVPCHRILAANGKMGGFSAHGGVGTKARLLALEGVASGPSASRAPSPTARARTACNDAPVLDPQRAVEHLRKVDPKLGALIALVGPCKIELKSTHSSFAALAEAIVYQQLNGKAAATIFGRFKAIYPGARFPKPEQVLATSDEMLRQAGLSGSKSRAIKDLAEKVQSGVVPSVAALRRMSNEEIVERLTTVRGIGRWTVEMLLMFRLGRPDVLPVDDFGVRKGYMVAFRKKAMPTPLELARYGERWQPHRTVASWYLWRAAELPKRVP